MTYNKQLDDYIAGMIVTLKNVRDFLREDHTLVREPTAPNAHEFTALYAYEFDVSAFLYSILSHSLNGMRENAHIVDTILGALQDLLDKNP